MSPCAPAGMYSHLPFALAQTSIELPYIVIQAVLFATITYWMMELETNPGTLLPPEAVASKTGLRCATLCCPVCWGPAYSHAVHCTVLPRFSCFCCPGLHLGLRSLRGLHCSCYTNIFYLQSEYTS